MSEPAGDPSSEISMGEVLRLPKRHPACRRREAQSGSCTERENLAGDAKGKGTSGSNLEAESTDAPERGGLLRSSYEADVMLAERRGQVIAVELGPTGYAGRSPTVQRKAAAFVRWHEPDDARASSPVLERLGVEFPGPTRHCSWCPLFSDDTSKADVACGRVHWLCMSGGRAIPAAIIWRAQMRAALQNFARKS